MILREIKNIFIKNRLTEGVDFKRYRYLKGTGGCYIDTMINPAWNDQLSAITEVSGRPTVVNPCILNAHGTNTRVGMVLGGAWYKNNTPQFLVLNKVVGTDDYIVWSDFPANAELYASFKVVNNSIPTISFKANGASWNINQIKGSSIITELPDTTYKIGDSLSGLNVLKLRNVKINLHNFTPCQLLKSIPATLDANNIARQAGECGIYDSISGKFFGNVANSGTFTVEGEVEPETHTGLQQIYQNKLIEGVDYQTADWLKADIPESIINMMSLPINSNNVEFKRNWIQVTNSEYFETSNYIYYITNYGHFTDLHPSIWRINPSDSQYQSSINVGLGIHTIVANNNGVTISGNSNVASVPWYGKPIAYMKFNSMMEFNTHTIHLTSSIKVDGVTRYVPCTLLRSIPRNLDAQCKDRVAGECGMIDLISGKFYGNVANSGTFTVENDTENNE